MNVENDQNMNSNLPKKSNLTLIIGTIVAIVLVGVAVMILILNNNSKSLDANNNTENGANVEHEPDTEIDETLNEMNKYWNINTKDFNASLFDGKFSISGHVIKSKLTGKKLKDYGYSLKIGSGLMDELLLDDDNTKYSDRSYGASILKNGEELLDDIHLYNYKKESDLYSDNTEISYSGNYISASYNDVIIPTCLINETEESIYESLEIDTIVDKLGVPTYVQNRTTTNYNDTQYFRYVYVYSDYTLCFDLVYTKGLGISVTAFTYEGSQTFNQPYEYYDSEKNEVRKYDKSVDYLKEEQTKYENSF